MVNSARVKGSEFGCDKVGIRLKVLSLLLTTEQGVLVGPFPIVLNLGMIIG